MSAKETIAVIGTVFVDIKGFADAHYDPAGRNVGQIKLVHGGVGRNVAEDVARLGGGVLFIPSHLVAEVVDGAAKTHVKDDFGFEMIA